MFSIRLFSFNPLPNLSMSKQKTKKEQTAVAKFFALVESEYGDDLDSKKCRTWEEAKKFLLETIDGDFYGNEMTPAVKKEASQSLVETGTWEFDGCYCNEHDTGIQQNKCSISIREALMTVVPGDKPIPKPSKEI